MAQEDQTSPEKEGKELETPKPKEEPEAPKVPEVPKAPREAPETPREAPKAAKVTKKKRWLKKIPVDVLLSPGGMLLLFFALFMEILDLFIPGGALTIEIIPEIIFVILLAIIAKVPIKNSLIPLLIERIPILSDVLPTWVLRMFV